METHEINIGGAVVYWTAGPTQRELLERRLELCGLSKFMPKERTVTAVLKSALLEYCDSHKTKQVDLGVQSHKQQSSNGFEVVEIERGERKNTYAQRFSVRATEGDCLNFDGEYWDHTQQVRELFDKHKGQLTGAAIGKMLVDILASMDGLPLRPSGGVYWIPESQVSQFETVATYVEETGQAESANRVYLLKTAMDAGTVRAVKDAITAEVMSVATQIVQDVQENLVTEDAINRRVMMAGELRQRVSRYESILGEGLTALQQVAQVAGQAAAAATAIKESNEVFDGVFAG